MDEPKPPQCGRTVDQITGTAEQRRSQMADFARFLPAQEDDERWEGIIASPKSRPKLDAFLKESAGEGRAEPLDPDRL